jgi:hypothetical protein
MSATSDMQIDGFAELLADTGSATVTYLTETVSAVWSTRSRGLVITDGPKQQDDAIRCSTLVSAWATTPSEGKIVSDAAGNQWRVVRRETAGAIITFILESKEQ